MFWNRYLLARALVTASTLFVSWSNMPYQLRAFANEMYDFLLRAFEITKFEILPVFSEARSVTTR